MSVNCRGCNTALIWIEKSDGIVRANDKVFYTKENL